MYTTSAQFFLHFNVNVKGEVSFFLLRAEDVDQNIAFCNPSNSHD